MRYQTLGVARQSLVQIPWVSRVHFSDYQNEIDSSCGIYHTIDITPKSIECYGRDVDLIGQREYQQCMRLPYIGMYSYTDSDYIICTMGPGRRSPESVESCKANIDRARESKRVEEEERQKIRCERRKDLLVTKCQREIQELERSNQLKRETFQQCVEKKRLEIETRLADQIERRKQEDERRREEKKQSCNTSVIKSLLCSSSEIEAMPECNETSTTKDTNYKKCVPV